MYASFGTIVWRYWTAEALAALGAIADVLEGMPGVRGLIGLGGTDPGPEAIRALTRPNVSVAGWVDQWRVLCEADAFFTHQGLNSTHEAIFHLVPMISYPFFHDQPALAETCQRLGLSVPLCESARGTVSETQVAAALARLTGGALAAGLAEARALELDVIAQRGSVVERIAGADRRAGLGRAGAAPRSPRPAARRPRHELAIAAERIVGGRSTPGGVGLGRGEAQLRVAGLDARPEQRRAGRGEQQPELVSGRR